MNTPSIEQVVRELFVVLKSWSGDMDAFRYEMFAKRLLAAEYGRPDAVEWANAWYQDHLAEVRQVEADALQRIAELEQRNAVARQELNAGRCTNPRYQAFLDTVEEPEKLTNHAAYMAWVGQVIGVFERTPGIKHLSQEERKTTLDRMFQEKRDANLAPRLRMQECFC